VTKFTGKSLNHSQLIFYQKKLKVSNLIATQSPSPIWPLLSCRRQPPCKPGDRKLFDIQGRNIILLAPGNSAKLRSYQDGDSAEAGDSPYRRIRRNSSPEQYISKGEPDFRLPFCIIKAPAIFQHAFVRTSKTLNLTFHGNHRTGIYRSCYRHTGTIHPRIPRRPPRTGGDRPCHRQRNIHQGTIGVNVKNFPKYTS